MRSGPIVVVAILMLLFAGNSHADVWAERAGGAGADQGNAVAVDTAGNIYVTGYFSGTVHFGSFSLTAVADKDIFVGKKDKFGRWLWVKRAGGSGAADEGRAIALDAAGNIYVAGVFEGSADFGTRILSASNSLQVVTAPGQLTFTRDNWNVPQQVTLWAIDDPVPEGTHFSMVQHTSSSGDPRFAAAVLPLEVKILDNDAAPAVGLVITESGGGTSVAEGTIPSDSYTVALASEPAASVTVNLAASDQRLSAVGLNGDARLIFSPENWQVPQTVTVTVQDDFYDQADTLPAQITQNVASTDPAYNGLVKILPVAVGDNDNPGLLFLDQVAISETGETQGTYRVTLATKPTAAVTVTLGFDASQVTVTPVTLTFVPTDWDSQGTVTKTVTVTARDDTVLEGTPHLVPITHTTASTGDPAYQGRSANLSVAVTDNDAAGLLISATSLVLAEGGTAASYQVRLSANPASPVTVAVNAAVAGQVTIDPATLTFLPGSATQPQTVTVAAVDDTATEFSPQIVAVHHVAASSDNRFTGLSGGPVQVAITDNDPATGPLVLVQKNVLSVPINGGTDTFAIQLASQPAETVTINLTHDVTRVQVVPAMLIYDATNWNVPQNVSVSATPGTSTPGPAGLSLSVTSSDPAYDGLVVAAVTVNVTAPPPAALVLTEAAGGTAVAEGGMGAAYTMMLQREPTGTVTVTLSTPDPVQVTFAPATLTFTGGPDGNWNLPRTVTVAAVDDHLVEGAHAGSIQHLTTSSDPSYQNLSRSLTVAVADNDTAGAAFSNSTVEVTEGRGAMDYRLRLTSQPSSPVTVAVIPNPAGQVAVTPTVITFTASNWQTPQTVSVAALYDTAPEGTQLVVLSHAATSSDATYQGVDLGTVTATVLDNTIPFRIVEPDTPVVSEDGQAASYHLVLSVQPTSDVTIQATTAGSTGSAGFIAKLDPSGGWLWATSVANGGNASSASIAVSAAGEAHAAGTASAGATEFGTVSVTGPGGDDAFAVKLNVDGTVRWAKKFGTGGNDRGNAIALDAAGNAFLAAFYEQPLTTLIDSTTTPIMQEQCVAYWLWCWDYEWFHIGNTIVNTYRKGQSIRLIRLDSSGIQQAEVAAGGDGNEEATAIAYQDGNPGYVHLTGSSTGAACFGGETHFSQTVTDYFSQADPAPVTGADTCTGNGTLFPATGRRGDIPTLFAARYRASDLGFAGSGGWVKNFTATGSSMTPIYGVGRAVVVDATSDGGIFVAGETEGKIASGKLDLATGAQKWFFATGDPAAGTAAARASALAPATGEIYVTGGLSGSVTFNDIRGNSHELVSAGANDFFLGKLEPLPPATATANWKDDRGQIRSVGNPLSPPVQACNMLPEIVDSYGANQTGSFFWHTPEGQPPQLYPLREVNVIVKWKLRKSPTDPTCQDDDLQNGVFPRATEYYNISWPENPYYHPVGTPVRLTARGQTIYTFNQLLYREGVSGASVTPEIEGTTTTQIFNATGTGHSVLLFITGSESNPVMAPAVKVQVVYSAPFDAPQFNGELFSDNVPWTIGTEISDPAHTISGENGFVLTERPPVDMGTGGRSAYDRAKRTGQIFPVSEVRPELNQELVVVWFDAGNPYAIAWPRKWVRYTPRWPANPQRIVIASGLGSELPGQPLLDTKTFPDLHIYQQPDKGKAGFNPNDEHALFAPSNRNTGRQALFALRNDLTASSAPYVLLKHRHPSSPQLWAFTVYRVEASDTDYPFSYDGAPDAAGSNVPFVAGTKVFAPYPLNRLLELQVCRESFGSGTSYWEDWKGAAYARSAGTANIYWFYPLQEGFFYDLDLDGTADRAPGQCVAWLGKGGQSLLNDEETERYGLTRLGLDLEDPLNRLRPVATSYTFVWPTTPPVLGVGETLITPKNGLPMIKDQAAAEIIYDDQDPEGAAPATKGLARLVDPISERWVTLEVLPDTINTGDGAGGRKVFSDLPYALRSRIFFDPLNKRLSFKGILNEDGVGEPLLLVNVLSSRERNRLLGLSNNTDYRKVVWHLYRSSRNPAALPGIVTEPLAETNTYALALISPPTKDVTVTITTSSPEQLTIVPTSVTFTPADWSVPKTVLVTQVGAGSAIPQEAEISHVVVSSDAAYDGRAVANVPVVMLQGRVTVTPGGSTGLLTGLWDDPATAAATLVPQPLVGITKALSAGLATGTGHLTLAFNNHPSLNAQPISLQIIRVDCPVYTGEIKVLDSDNIFDEKLSVRHSGDFVGDPGQLLFEWYYRPAPPYESLPLPIPEADQLNGWTKLPESGPGVVDITIEGAGPLTISDNLLITRYRGHPVCGGATQWSPWAGAPRAPQSPFQAQLAEGWIKRVLDKLNPYEARGQDFERSAANTFASMLIQAGQRYEGPIALTNDPEAINRVGLIEAYSTVLDRGRDLSIDATPPVQYPPANSSLLLAAGRIADLYLLLGNEAYGDAQDQTIGFGTESSVYGTLAPTIFAFQNQLGSQLEEELTLLRGRDKTAASPIYNRLFWNFTRGEGELAYSQVYNMRDQNGNGTVDEVDAGILFPQGHGDAWGHYLTAIKTYYTLLRHPNFDWQPRTEQVLVAGTPVDVDYLDERKFAQVAAARAKAAAEIVDLTYRAGYVEDPAGQWQGYKDSTPVRAWGLAEWSRRAGQGAYLDWVVGNAILPEKYDKPTTDEIQKIDRTTIRELAEIAAQYRSVQAQVDEADQGLNPLGLAKGVVPFDIDPLRVAGGETHFEQIHDRALKALQNAARVFNHANQQSEMLRRNEDTLEDFRTIVGDREQDFQNRLIELFGYPYADDIGPNGTYPSGYVGPDLYHYMYVDASELTGNGPSPITEFTAYYTPIRYIGYYPGDDSNHPATQIKEVTYHQSLNGYGLVKPGAWSGSRRAPGEIQVALSDLFQNRARFEKALREYEAHIGDIRGAVDLLEARYNLKSDEISLVETKLGVQTAMNAVISTTDTIAKTMRCVQELTLETADATAEALPTDVGLANDVTAPARSAIKLAGTLTAKGFDYTATIADIVGGLAEMAKGITETRTELSLTTKRAEYEVLQRMKELEQLVRQEAALRLELYTQKEVVQQSIGRYLTTLAKGERLLEELISFRQGTAAKVQEYRYQDMTFRIFRNDALQKYRAAFDLAARYTYLAATAYDYETNLLGNNRGAGRKFLTDIVRQRNLGQLIDGQPLAGAPGLADPLARMAANFEVYKGQLGFNNPQTETNRFSLRYGLFRLHDSSDDAWRGQLERYRVANLWDVPEFRRYCRAFAPETAGPQPGLVIPFSTNVTFGLNFFGFPLSGGDSAYDASNFATRVRSVGVWFSNYNGTGLAETPRVYLVPAGMDVLRSPAANSFATREWRVMDQVLPVPFPIGALDLDEPGWIPAGSTLSDEQGAIRRFSSFRAYHDSGSFAPAELSADSRLIGRSVWNTKWLLIIPAGTLLANTREGLDTFIHGQLVPGTTGMRDGRGIKDIKLFFQTYAYSGN